MFASVDSAEARFLAIRAGDPGEMQFQVSVPGGGMDSVALNPAFISETRIAPREGRLRRIALAVLRADLRPSARRSGPPGTLLRSRYFDTVSAARVPATVLDVFGPRRTKDSIEVRSVEAVVLRLSLDRAEDRVSLTPVVPPVQVTARASDVASASARVEER